jgi:hypothetical protein
MVEKPQAPRGTRNGGTLACSFGRVLSTVSAASGPGGPVFGLGASQDGHCVARLVSISVRTAKRRASSGRDRFMRHARRDPLLARRIVEQGHFLESDDG